MSRPKSRTRVRVGTVEGGRMHERTDHVATEEPLEVRLAAGGQTRTVAVTMRTPGNDFELSAGFLFAEGVIPGRDAIRRITYCTDPELDAEQRYNVVNVELRTADLPELPSLERHFHTTSACGVCGKASLEALRLRVPRAPEPEPAADASDPATRGARPAAHEVLDEGIPPRTLDVGVLRVLPDRLRAAQSLFDSTGGLHAAGLFTIGGDLVCTREDVGRHNAVDKVVGWAVLDDRAPLEDHILLVSGRTSFEILQKAAVAGIPIVCSVSAPSSLAVAVARDLDITLVGFLRGERFNVYAGAERLRGPPV
jgi:FdhD protein